MAADGPAVSPNDVLTEMAPAATAGAVLVDFLLWMGAAAAMLIVLGAARNAIRQLDMMPGQRDYGRAGRMVLAALVLGSPLLFADVIKRSVFGSDEAAHEAPKGVDFMDAPFGAPPPPDR